MKFDEQKILALGFTKDNDDMTALGRRVWYISRDQKIGVEYRLVDGDVIDQIFIASQPGDSYYEISKQYFDDFEERMADVLVDMSPSVALN